MAVRSVANPSITEAISSQTELLHAYRFVRLLEQGEIGVAVEIKGIRAEALAARGHLDRIMAAYRKFNDAAPSHASDVEGLSEQIGSLQSDLEFAANVLGNSGGSGVSQAPPVVQVQTVAHTDVGDAGHILQREVPIVPSIYPITQNPPKQR